ncbi:6-carboxytetrahydropterin synthase [Halorussus sp. MSC15.2]|uniref:6-pyruvoyl trahydropterin synthase family protein n=1 Tax=Halorussus sp. MSC15.2 TaxID=2283638 RepID=UPI0013D06F8D|nr:6-carboxytetrahydropterin synthase [Halorussus sp. MSC15.2]NEU57819.1 6-carboxytetrahydropterin synthase [Halorussus sp. MSC15.2]
MYTVTVQRDFVAQHFLTVPDPGPEGDLHSHHYTATVELAGERLNEYGYLADIDAVAERLDATVDRYRDATLNDLPEFEGRNPSLEHFARLFGGQFWESLDAPEVESVTVSLREDDVARASHERAV